MRLRTPSRVTESGRRGATRLLVGVLLGAFSFVGSADAGEATDFTGAYAGVNVGYGFGHAREHGAVTPPDGVGQAPRLDRSLPPSAAAAARTLRTGRGAASDPGRD